MNLLEIVLPTYNRVGAIKEWLETLSSAFDKYDFILSVFDSSTNNDTQELILKNINSKINYKRYDSNLEIDRKTILCLQSATAKYVWLCADTRIPNIEKVFETINFSYEESDIILFYPSQDAIERDFYDNKDDFFYSNFFRLTTYGASICKREVIEKIDLELMVSQFGGKGFIYPCTLAKYTDAPYKVLSGKYLLKLSVETNSGWTNNKTAVKIWTKQLQESVQDLRGVLSDSTIDGIIKTRGSVNHFLSKRGLMRLRISDNFNAKIYKEYKEYLLKSLACTKFSAICIAYTPKWICRVVNNFIALIRRIVKGKNEEG